MDRIFVYENKTPIKFYIDIQDRALGRRVKAAGGALTSALDAEVHIGKRALAGVLPVNPMVPVINPRWITECIKRGGIVPVYQFVDDPAQQLLQHLSTHDRDLAEILKVRACCPGEHVFDMLHQRFPHHTSNAWRRLYQHSQVVIQLTLAQIRPALQEQLNRLVIPIFGHQATPAPQNRLGQLQDDAPRVPDQVQDEPMYEEDNRPANLSDYFVENADGHTNSAASKRPPQTPSRREDITDDDDYDYNGDEGRDDNDGDYAEPGKRSRSGDTKTTQGRPRRYTTERRGGGIRVWEKDYENMARYLQYLGRDPTVPDWEYFYNMAEENQNRSAHAWSAQYYTNRHRIAAAASRLGIDIVWL